MLLVCGKKKIIFKSCFGQHHFKKKQILGYREWGTSALCKLLVDADSMERSMVIL